MRNGDHLPCPKCGSPMERRSIWCQTCRRAAMAEERKAKIEEALFLIGAGTSADRVAATLDSTPSTLGRLLRRYGHPKAARAFEAADRKRQREQGT